MIIQNSSINTQSSRYYRLAQVNYEKLTVWDNSSSTITSSLAQNTQVTEEMEGINPNQLVENSKKDVENETESSSLEDEFQTMLKHYQSTHKTMNTSLEEKVKTIQKIQRETLNYLLRILLGRTEKSPLNTDFLTNEPPADDNNFNEQATSVGSTSNSVSNKNDSDSADSASASDSNVGGTYSTFHYYSETETTDFHTKGTVITADGREMSFNISLTMSRSFTQMASTHIDFGAPRLCDPLVINLNTNIANVSNQKFFFDINADGEKEYISMLDSASGYLALDKNEDGVINDGNELFGTQSGNGFYDLLQYDTDGNGWIDEADEIFQKLKIWQMTEDGTSSLIDLKEAGVGAIYLGYEDTKFSLNNAQNKTNAIIQKTGLFLYENGYTGTIQQMDLAV